MRASPPVITKTASLFDDFEYGAIIEPIRSPLNYIGGKYKLLPQILKFFPSEINCFVDLFCGGCNVGININANQVCFNDNLVYLIDLYKVFKEYDLNFILGHIYNRISSLSLSLTNAEGYIQLRNLYNSSRNPLDLFVLVAYSFNHQIRFNSAHEFNNPFGKERSCFNPSMEKNLINFVDRLHSIECSFSNSDFRNFDFTHLGEKDFVYCDPPYLITTGTYNDGKRGFTGWTDFEEKNYSHCLILSILKMLSSLSQMFSLTKEKQITF